MILAPQSGSYEAVFDIGIPGLVGTIEMKVEDNQGVTITATSAASCVEIAGGVYAFTRTTPGTAGDQFTAIASSDGTYDEGTVAVDDILVTESVLAPFDPLPSPGQTGAPSMGPCSAWTTPEAVALCCNADVGTALDLYEDAIDEASEFLYFLSGKRFGGSCQRTVRPCGSGQSCGVQTLPWGRVIGWSDGRWEGPTACGCSPLQKIDLAGYPVREIVEVKIDGVAVDADTYELQRFRELVRMNDPDTGAALYWPACQNLARPSTEDGTFSVTYTYGLDPPRTGQRAAAELACQLYRSCNPDETGATDCALPAGVTRVTRNGVVIERQAFGAWAYHPTLRIWRTGIPALDGFLNWANPSGLRRRPAFASPDGPRYARAG